jgi:hypothetical protein
MPSRLYKPPVPETPDFWDRLEADLRRKAAANAKGLRRRTTWMARLLRPMMRPVLHGAMALVALAMVGALGLPRSSPASGGSEEVRMNSAHLTGWVPVVEVEDPRAPVVFYAMIDRVPRFTSFVESPTGEPIHIPEDLSAL